MITCRICPHECQINENEVGECGVIKNIGGKLSLSKYGELSILAVEPIEKRPFFHFFPGTKWLSAGFYGCSFKCLYCQNHKVSQNVDGEYKYYSPDDLILECLNQQSTGIAFTFNEPTIYYQYLMDVGYCAKKSKIPLCIKTNGFVNTPIINDLSQFFSAFNVDIKGDNDEYDRICGGTLQPVMTATESIFENKKHLEISYLVMPRLLYNVDFHHYISDWISSMDKNMAVHILYFYPFHKMTDVSYLKHQLMPVIDIFKKKLVNVYLSNVYDNDFSKFRNSYCPKCGIKIVDRSKYPITIIDHSCDS